MEGHDRLEQPGRAGGGLGVADLRFDRPQRAALRPAVAVVEHRAEPFELGRVARARGGAVRLDQPDGLRTVSSSFVRAPDRLRLPLGHRCVHAARLPVGRSAQPAHDGIDPVAVAFGVLQPLQRDHPDPLAEDRPVRAVREWPAIAGSRKRGGLAEAGVHQDVVQRVDTPSDHQVGMPGLEFEQGQVQRG